MIIATLTLTSARPGRAAFILLCLPNYCQPGRQLPAVLNGQAYDGANNFNLFRPDGCACWQRHDPLRQPLGLRQQQPCMREIGPVRLHLMAAGIEIASRQNVLGMEHMHQIISADAGGNLIYLDDHVLVVAALGLVVGDELECPAPPATRPGKRRSCSGWRR